jgi:hypothetical protein
VNRAERRWRNRRSGGGKNLYDYPVVAPGQPTQIFANKNRFGKYLISNGCAKTSKRAANTS